jgi:hypothetical protein
MYERPGKLVRVHKDVEGLIRELAELTGYEPYTVRNLAILLGLEKLAYLAEKQVKKDFPPTPFLSEEEFWRLHTNAEQSVRKLKEAVLLWKERKVVVYA